MALKIHFTLLTDERGWGWPLGTIKWIVTDCSPYYEQKGENEAHYRFVCLN